MKMRDIHYLLYAIISSHSRRIFFLCTTIVIGAILVISSWLIYRRHKEKVKEWVKKALSACGHYTIWALVRTITLPVKFIQALFYVPSIGPDGEVERKHFSIVRFMFLITCALGMFRLFIGGATFEKVAIGPEIEMKSAVKKKAKKRKRRTKAKDIAKTRPYISVAKIVYHHLTLYELGFILIIVLLYYFRDEVNKGDTTGIFDHVISYALATKGIHVPADRVSRTIEIAEEVELADQKDPPISPDEPPQRGIG